MVSRARAQDAPQPHLSSIVSRNRSASSASSRTCRSSSSKTECPANSFEAPYENADTRWHSGASVRRRDFTSPLRPLARAGIPLVLAGETFPYQTHVEYYEQKLRPHLSERIHFVGPVGLARKRRLLTGAQCLLVPSLAPETSSLVSMEALACGTPVIAYAQGALPEIVEHGRTGFIVNNVVEMADAIHRVGQIDPEECRRVARDRFSSDRMACDYMNLYEDLLNCAFDESGAPRQDPRKAAPGGWSR